MHYENQSKVQKSRCKSKTKVSGDFMKIRFKNLFLPSLLVDEKIKFVCSERESVYWKNIS